MKRSRRAVLQAAALVGSLGVAGCHQGGDSSPNNNPGNGNGNGGTSTNSGSGTGTGTGTGTDSPAGGSTATPDPVGDVERWNKLQYDNLNTGAVDLNHGSFESGTVNWSVNLNGSPGLQPAFDEERVYAPTRKALYAIDRDSGEVVWRYDANEGPVSTPLLRDGFVYAVTGAGVIKLKNDAGWNALDYRFNSTIKNLLSVVAPSAPVYHNGKIIFNVIIKTSGDRGKQVSRIVAIDLDGNRVWYRLEPFDEYRDNNEPYTVLPPGDKKSPANRRNRHDNFLRDRQATSPAGGFAPTPCITGTKPGSKPTPTPSPTPTPTPSSTPSPTPTPETSTPTPTASPTPSPTPTPRPRSMRASTLYVTHGWDKRDATIYALNPDNGRRKNWRPDPFNSKIVRGFRDYKGKGWSTISAKRGLLFFADRFADIFEAADGDKVVRRTLDPPPNAYACAIGPDHAFMSSRVYEGNEGQLFAVDDAGRVDWTFSGEGNLFTPTATNDTVYVTSASGALFALDIADGLVRWRQDLGVSGPVDASGPAVSTNAIYTIVGGSGNSKLVSVSPVK